MNRCRQTAAILDRLIAGEMLDPAQRAHLSRCAICTHAMPSVPRFEAALGAAAASLVQAPMPAAILTDAVLGAPASRRPAHGPSGLAVAAVVILAVAVVGAAGAVFTAQRPAGIGRSVDNAAAELRGVGYTCRPDGDGRVCLPTQPMASLDLSVSLDGSANGQVTRVVANGRAENPANPSDALYVRSLLRRSLEIAFPDRAMRTAGLAWLNRLLASDGTDSLDATTTIGGLVLHLQGDPADGFALSISPD